MSNITKLNVQGKEISVTNVNNDDYICLTDMVKAKEDDIRAADIIKNWIRNRGTIEFLGTWESIYNKNFKVVEFDHFRKEAGLPTFTLSVSNWVEKTNAIGIFSKAGKAGGTYAHKDIAFEFGAAISPIFKLYVIKEYQRLKDIEANTGMARIIKGMEEGFVWFMVKSFLQHIPVSVFSMRVYDWHTVYLQLFAAFVYGYSH